jgi:DNA transformation protein
MAVTTDFCAFVIGQLAMAGQVTSRRMFGGLGLYLDGLFFALIDDDVLYFKADDSTRQRYERAGMQPFCPYPDRPDKSMGYWEVPAEVLEDAEQLAVWAREAMQVALAAKAREPARKRIRVRRRPPRRR